MSLSRLSLNSSFLYDYTLMVLQNGPYDDKIKKNVSKSGQLFKLVRTNINFCYTSPPYLIK